jgi:SOS response regulatory protein OraA/RecX
VVIAMIIKKIEIKEKMVKISLDDKTSFIVSLETYLNNKILLNEEITKKEINDLENSSKKDLSKIDLLNKIARKKLSKKECQDFLAIRNLSEKEIKEIILEFERNYLINDLELAEFIIDYCLNTKKGKVIMKQRLVQRQISLNYDLVIEEYLDKERYDNNIRYLIDKYCKIGKSKSNAALKNYLCLKMSENGYLKEEFTSFILDKNNNERDIIIIEVNKFFKSHEKNKENIAKITKKLLSKGFNYDIIREIIRECESSEAY